MEMKILKAKHKKIEGSRIFLVRRGQEANKFITDSKELAYITEKLEGDKPLAILNRLDHLVICMGMGKEELPLSKRLEKARIAGFEVHGKLNEYGF
jgi:hypothetical protein